jgi:hypothetical protein
LLGNSARRVTRGYRDVRIATQPQTADMFVSGAAAQTIGAWRRLNRFNATEMGKEQLRRADVLEITLSREPEGAIQA